ncbi:methyltransferase domain-containing protein [Bacillus cereus group sp. N14]|uniref:class I SAM-dependent methyltransferase n=1 Tax=Bacillus cereus group sp. N14 TaxID=2794587 RepID=UPI0018F6FC90|nr:class I SAM-dependent methyltransferase [Bacillus cereus group sp. N14]MBJ8083204.1 methyltransferase domain-containing protein [Bacillus cereus group sp. N14]
MKNHTNKLKYKGISIIYDYLMSNKLFIKARERAFSLLPLKSKQDILFVGVGTGEDFRFIPSDVNITGIDLSQDMLNKAKTKIKENQVTLLQMNAEQLQSPDESFDVVSLNLILSVVEHPKQALAEALRVTKQTGFLLIFDKFLPEEMSSSISRSIINSITSFLGTDINRKFSDICIDLPMKIVYEEPSIFKGIYKIILVQREV